MSQPKETSLRFVSNVHQWRENRRCLTVHVSSSVILEPTLVPTTTRMRSRKRCCERTWDPRVEISKKVNGRAGVSQDGPKRTSEPRAKAAGAFDQQQGVAYKCPRSNMTRRVYIIGAGASASAPYNLPTLKTFAGQLYASLSAAEQRIMADTVFHACSVDLRYAPDPKIDIEELLNRLDRSAIDYLPKLPRRSPPIARTWTARELEAVITRFLKQRCKHLSQVTGPFDRLIEGIGDNTSFISFNWDVLLELALIRKKRAYVYLDDNEDEPNWINRPKTTYTNTTTLLKPHGSINWYALLDREGISIDVGKRSNVYPLGCGTTEYRILYLKNPVGRIRMGDTEPWIRGIVGSYPAIVPPNRSSILSVGGKPADGWVEDGHSSWMKAIWRNVRTKLQEADEIVIIGYSLPGTDLASIKMLAHCVGQRKGQAPQRIAIIDRNPEVAKRYSRIIQTDVELVGRDFAHFDPKFS